VALEHAEVVVGVLWLIVVAANPLTARAAQSLLAGSWSVHNPLVDQTLSDEIISLCQWLVLKTLLLLWDTAALLLVLMLLDLRRTLLLPVVPVGNLLLLLLAVAAATKVDSLWVCFGQKEKCGTKYCPRQPHSVSKA
jgi:hypothetical protein